ncbi:MAG: branched-chain amino acid ABC transporter permease [Betaproteobacteria bacterium]
MLQNLLYGLTIGGILYITSIGLSLTYGTMRIVNFAHGILYTLGAYGLVASLARLTGNFAAGAAVGVLAVAPIAYLIDRLVIQRLRAASVDYVIIATYALIYVGVDAIKWIWGPNPIPLSDPIGKLVTLPGTTLTLPVYRLVIIGAAILTYLGLRQFFKRTLIGKIVVAGLEDPDGVKALGIDVDRCFSLVFLLGSCLAALGGVLYAPITTVQPYMGMTILRLGFAVVLVGGLGNLNGTFWSALGLGLLMSVTSMFWGAAAEASVFVVMAIALILKPEVT